MVGGAVRLQARTARAQVGVGASAQGGGPDAGRVGVARSVGVARASHGWPASKTSEGRGGGPARGGCNVPQPGLPCVGSHNIPQDIWHRIVPCEFYGGGGGLEEI